MGSIYDSDDELNDAGMINKPQGENLKPVLHNEQLPSGNIHTNSTPLPQAIKEIEEETAEERGEEAEGETILESRTEDNRKIKSSYNPFTSLKNSLDRDGDGEATLTDIAGYVKDGVVGTSSVIKEATGINEVAKGVERQTTNTIYMIGAVALAYLLIKG